MALEIRTARRTRDMFVALSFMLDKRLPIFKVQITFLTVLVLHLSMTIVVSLRSKG